MTSRFGPTLLAAGALACSGRATIVPPPDARVEALMTKHGLPAVGIAIIENGRIAWSKVYGEQAPGVRATDATLFNVASLTKPITAETILRLVAAGKDRPRRGDVAPLDRSRPRSRPAARAPDPPHLAQPSDRFPLGRFAEKKLGRTFESLAAEYLFGPIRLENTSFSARPWMARRNALPKDSSGTFGASQVPAEGRWNAFVIGVMRGDRMSASLTADRFRIHRSMDGQGDCKATRPENRCPTAHGMTLGWERFDYPEGPLLMHTGNNPWGESSIAYFQPDRRHGLVILTNGANLTRAYFEFFALLDPASPLAAWPR